MNPRMQIRRFDVFAEYKRLEARKHGLDAAHAKGYGLWVAKVVASGGGRGSKATSSGEHHDGDSHDHTPRQDQWHQLGGEDQTDTMFDHEIVARMGNEFYHDVFAPAIEDAFNQGKRYESIRDTIRKNWKPGA